ncbi:MAG: hypothetical protein ACE5GW_02750 [Planctomycetota bacterium]
MSPIRAGKFRTGAPAPARIAAPVRVLVCALACAFACGCAVQSGGGGPSRLPAGFQPLSGEEVVLQGGGARAAAWITAGHRLLLSYQPGGAALPMRVDFLCKRRGSRTWLPVGSWSPGRPPVAWRPPGEGQWALHARPSPLKRLGSSALGGEAYALIAVDWTPPALEVQASLPRGALHGGEEIPLEWSSRDPYPAANPVHLEIREGRSGSWRRIVRLPPRGRTTWQVPGRGIAGARLRMTARDAVGNTRSADIPGTLSVRGSAPGVRLLPIASARAPDVSIPYELPSPGSNDVARVELWVTRDGGVSWQLGGYDHDRTPPLEVTLEEGRWGLWIVVTDERGSRSPYPQPGDAPAQEIVVDWTPPRLRWGSPVAAQVASREDGTPLLEVSIPFEVEDRHLDEASIEISRRSSRGEWTAADGDARARGAARCRRALDDPDPLALRVTGHDLAGNPFTAETTVYPGDLLRPPAVRFEDPPRGWHRGGEPLLLRYRTEWSSGAPKSADLLYSLDGERWSLIEAGLPPSGSYPWEIPRWNRRGVLLRARVRSADGRQVAADLEAPIAIDSEPPVATILGPRSGSGSRIPLLLEAGDGDGSGVDHLELHARARGAAVWELAGRSPPGELAIAFAPPIPADYELWLTAVDRVGNHSPGPPQGPGGEGFRLVVSEGSPGIRLLSFQQGDVYGGGSRHGIFLDWSGDPPIGGVVAVEHSGDDGATWLPIGNIPLGTPRISWVLPRQDLPRCRVRATAREIGGRTTSDQSRVPFAIDASPPALTVGALEPAPEGKTRIIAEGDDVGGAGLRRIRLYLTRDGGESWTRVPEPLEAGEELIVELPEGTVGIALSGIDAVGNEAPAPSPGTPPQAVRDAAPRGSPRLVLLNPGGTSIAGGSRHYLFWRLEAAGTPFRERPVILDYRLEGQEEWIPIAAELPAEGRIPWQVPAFDGKRLWLRARAVGRGGERLEAILDEPFLVDSRRPRVTFDGPAASNERSTVVRYRIPDGETLSAVELWVRAVSTPEWRRVAGAKVGQQLAGELADGMYRVALVAVDPAGNRAPTPTKGGVGQGRLLVDTVPPLLELDGLGGKERLFHEGEVLVIRPRVTDRHLSPYPIGFRMSANGGATFTGLKRFHPNAEEYRWRLPERAGSYTLEVCAIDLAGNQARQLVPVRVIASAPRVRILADPGGSILAAGDDLHIEWESSGVEPLHRGLSIDFSSDGAAWQRIFDDLTADGRVAWKLPAVDSNRCRLRLTLRRPDGLTARRESGVFTISATAPRVRVEGVRPAGGDD